MQDGRPLIAVREPVARDRVPLERPRQKIGCLVDLVTLKQTNTRSRHETRVEANRGGAGNRPSDEELARKFHDQRRQVPPGGARGRDRGPNARPS
jgi:hypothetical protein